ncbi:MAG: hypothetical protein ACOYD4_03960 [Solirubrobacterales bacterium]
MIEAPAAPQATEQQSPAPESGSDKSTLESLVGDWDKSPTPEADGAGLPASGEKPKADAAKPEGKPDAEKPAAEKPAAEVKPPPQKLFQAHEALKKSHKTIEQERDQLRTQVAELSKAKAEGADPKEIETLRKELETTKAELRESAYERSAEYRQQYVEKRTALYKEAVEEITALTVTVKGTDVNGDEVESERPATEADFRRLYFMSPRDQDKAIAEMFGPSAARVHAHLNELARNGREASVALQKAREDADGRSRKTQEQATLTQKNYEKAVKESAENLQTKWPQWFKVPPTEGENADKELAEAHTGGINLVQEFKAKAGSLSVEDAAAYSAVIEARAGSWPKLVVELRRANEKIKAYEARLKGKEASDPGAGGGTKPAGEGAPEENDIEGMAKAWDKA